MRVALKKMLVFSVKTSSFARSFVMSAVMGPTCRHETEKLEGSSLRPKGWPQPPLRACEMWQATPGTLGSSKSLTQTLSFGESRLKVVLTQPMSSARAEPMTAKNSAAATRNNFIFLSTSKMQRLHFLRHPRVHGLPGQARQ